MSRLSNSITPSLKLLFQRSPSAVGNIRHFVSFCTSGSIRSVGKVNPNNIHKSCCGVAVGNGYGNMVRTISSSVKCLKDVEESKEIPEVKEDHKKSSVPLGSYVKTNLRQKRMLVWSKKYPSVADVPEYVHESQMVNATDISRIKANVATIVLFLIASYITIKIGQNQRAKYIVQRQEEADEYHDMMDLFDAELDKAAEKEKKHETKKR